VRKVFLWLRGIQAATAIEYCLIVAGIAVAIAVGVFSTGGSLTVGFRAIEGAVSSFLVSGG
jgi:Flp pilus assembly pilin Flp